MENTNNKLKIFKFKEQKYNFQVTLDEKSNLLKVTLTNINTKEEIPINIAGLIPSGATPDYVLLNSTLEKEMVDRMIELKILDFCNGGIFAKFNMEKLYEYDPEGIKTFLKFHTHEVEYEDKGTTVEEVKREMKEYTESLLKSQEVINYIDECNNDNIEEFIFMYSIVDKNNPQNSIIAYCNDNADRMYLINPYIKGISNKFDIRRDWEFNFYDEMISFLSRKFEIIDIGKYSHYSIWEEISNNYDEPEFKSYNKGVQKYLRYCKKNNITQNFIKEMYNLEHLDDVMKYYKTKSKEK